MKYYMAPLEGITGHIYRTTYAKYFGGIDKYFSPFISPNQKKICRTREKKDILPENNAGLYLVPQIMTNQAEMFLQTVEYLQQFGYNEVNLNLCRRRCRDARPLGPFVYDNYGGVEQHGRRSEAVVQGGRVHDGLERATGLALSLRDAVELRTGTAEGIAAHHGHHVAVFRLYGNHGSLNVGILLKAKGNDRFNNPGRRFWLLRRLPFLRYFFSGSVLGQGPESCLGKPRSRHPA